MCSKNRFSVFTEGCLVTTVAHYVQLSYLCIVPYKNDSAVWRSATWGRKQNSISVTLHCICEGNIYHHNVICSVVTVPDFLLSVGFNWFWRKIAVVVFWWMGKSAFKTIATYWRMASAAMLVVSRWVHASKTAWIDMHRIVSIWGQGRVGCVWQNVI